MLELSVAEVFIVGGGGVGVGGDIDFSMSSTLYAANTMDVMGETTPPPIK